MISCMIKKFLRQLDVEAHVILPDRFVNCDSLNRTPEVSDSLSPTQRVVFFLFYLHVRSKHKTLNLYTRKHYCFFVVRHVGKARLDTLVTLDTFVSTRSTKSNVSSRVESSGIWALWLSFNFQNRAIIHISPLKWGFGG